MNEQNFEERMAVRWLYENASNIWDKVEVVLIKSIDEGYVIPKETFYIAVEGLDASLKSEVFVPFIARYFEKKRFRTDNMGFPAYYKAPQGRMYNPRYFHNAFPRRQGESRKRIFFDYIRKIEKEGYKPYWAFFSDTLNYDLFKPISEGKVLVCDREPSISNPCYHVRNNDLEELLSLRETMLKAKGYLSPNVVFLIKRPEKSRQRELMGRKEVDCYDNLGHESYILKNYQLLSNEINGFTMQSKKGTAILTVDAESVRSAKKKLGALLDVLVEKGPVKGPVELLSDSP